MRSIHRHQLTYANVVFVFCFSRRFPIPQKNLIKKHGVAYIYGDDLFNSPY